MDRFLGKRVGPYKLVKRLGVGGMAAVYLGRHNQDGSQVAVKILHRRHIGDADLVRRFMDEERAARSIDHPGIVQVFSCDRSPELGVYLVMEHLEGQTLLRRWREHARLAPATFVLVLHQVAEAMQAAHAAGVIHRDLKPSNVFLARDPEAPGGERAKVLDFGVAKLLHGGSGTRTGYHIGTLCYMSPEQLQDSKYVDLRTDIYSLGVMSYFLLTGELPYEDETIDRYLMGTALPPPSTRPLRGVPDELVQVILRAMEHQLEQRFASMAELDRALLEACPLEQLDQLPETWGLPAEAEPDDEGTLALQQEEMADIARARPAAPLAARPRSWLLLLPVALVFAALAALVALSGAPLETLERPTTPQGDAGALAPRVTALPDPSGTAPHPARDHGLAAPDRGAPVQRTTLKKAAPGSKGPSPRTARVRPVRRVRPAARAQPTRPVTPQPTLPPPKPKSLRIDVGGELKH